MIENFKFFTDKSVKNDYLLIKINDYLKMKDFSNWKEVFIDPAVFELTNSYEYSFENKINVLDFLNSLPENHYFTFDYPSDMNIKYQNLFISKTWNNAKKYNNYNQFITTAQYKFNDFWNFTEWFDKYNSLSINSGILGLGNLCRIHSLTEYLENILDYAFSCCNHSRIHIYGLCLKAIPFSIKLANRYNIKLSIDSTKWTKACTENLKNKYGLNCNRKNRQEFFNTYLELINERISMLHGKKY